MRAVIGSRLSSSPKRPTTRSPRRSSIAWQHEVVNLARVALERLGLTDESRSR